ncbi:response regulator [Tundrisphaera sp. TA3]|uniref:response regulator n=1 Tax=Tundrisphaera sp. TA3 TaxID=3435775 RepID=UPI003EBDFAE4
MSQPARILIVDDEPNVRLVFRAALESRGYAIAEAVDGPSALEALAGSRADLVLMDLQMPGIDGIETLRRLREGGNDVPVIFISAHGRVPDAVAAMKLGAIDFLAKPLTPDVLRRLVAEVVQRHASAEPEAEPAAAEPEPTPAFVSPFAVSAATLSKAKRALNRRQFAQAEAILGQALKLDPNSAEAHNLMGVLYELRNEHDASYRAYCAALKADPDHEAAQQNMRRYYERFTFGASKVPVNTGG